MADLCRKLVNGSGEVRITANVLSIVIDDEEVLQDDTNPGSPPGWWKAVDGLGQRTFVTILPAESPMRRPTLE